MSTRLRIEYSDQNEAFASYLPRTGVVRREVREPNGSESWFLLDLEEPFDYQLKVGDPYQFRRVQVNAFLVRSRWRGKEVGDPEGTSVFILLVEAGKHPVSDQVDLKSYINGAWGMCWPAVAA